MVPSVIKLCMIINTMKLYAFILMLVTFDLYQGEIIDVH